MARALIASGIIHVTMLCLAHFGIGPTLGFLGGVLSLGWEFILAIFLALLALLLALLFGFSALAGMGAGAAVALVVAAVAMLALADHAPGDAAARELDRTEAARRAAPPRPLDVAVVGDPQAPRSEATDDEASPPRPPAPRKADDATEPGPAAPSPAERDAQRRMFSATFGNADRDGISKTGRTVKGKLWTVELPSAINSAAERTTGDAMTRQQLRAGAEGEQVTTEPAKAAATESARQQATRQQAKADPARDARPPAPPAGGRTAARNGVKQAFDNLAKVMPRLSEIRKHLEPAVPPVRQAGLAQGESERPAREAVMARIAQRAEEGYAHAQFNLAEMLLTSPRGKESVAEARRLLERAAVGGYMPAQILLAMLEGEGAADARPNLAKAHAWLSVAAARGNKAALAARDDIARQLRDGEEVRARLEAVALQRTMAAVAPRESAGDERKKVNEQLRHAAVLGDSEAVHVLLAKNADADDADQDGRTPLIEAAWRGYPGIVDALVRAGAKIDARDTTGKTSVAWAAINGHAEVIRKLAAAGSAIDTPDDEGFTPLMRAAWNGHAGAVRVLLGAGARPDVRNRQGRSAADYARDQGSRPVLRALAGSKSR